MNSYNPKYYRKHKTRISAVKKKYYLKYKERIKEKSRFNYKKWSVKNKDKIKIKSTNYYKKNKKRINEKAKLYRLNLRKNIISHYSSNKQEVKCACCGEKQYKFLSIDHINGGGYRHRKKIGGGYYFYSWIKKNNYPRGFQILCHNCNQAKGTYGVCPHMS